MKLKPEHAKLAGYFNLDNGTGKIRGVYLQGNDMMRPIFEAWLAPFKDLGAHHDHDPQHRRHGSPVVRRRRAARLPVHPGPDGIRHPHAPLEHGRLRPPAEGRPDAGVRRDGVVRVQHGEARPEMLPRKPLPKPQPARRKTARSPIAVTPTGGQ